MADLAELGFVVKDEPLARAEDKLDRLIPAADKAAKATDRFNKAAGDSPSVTTRMASGLSNLTTVAARFATGLLAAFSINMLSSYADAWSDMQSRVGAAIKDMEAAPALMQRLVDVANASYSPLSQTVEIYGRNVAVLKDLGRNAAEAADFTESLNHMLVITATRGERAESVQNALSKAMAVGKLQADGLETVLANGGRVAEALASELGTTVSGLRKFASEGKITGEVIARAIIKPLETVREEAGAMTATLGDAFVILNNNVTAAIGTLDKATGTSAAVASAIILLAENLDILPPIIGGLAAMIATALTPALFGATAAMYAFTASLLSNPLTAIAVVIALLVARIITLIQEVGGVGAAFQAVQIVALDVWTRITAGGNALVATLQGSALRIKAAFSSAFVEIDASFANMIAGLGPAGEWLGFNAEAMQKRVAGMRKDAEGLNAAADAAFASAANFWSTAQNGARLDAAGMGASWKEFNTTLGQTVETTGAAVTTVTALTDAQKKAAQAYSEVVKGAKDFITEQALEASALGLTTVQANTMRYAQDLLNKATANGQTITAAQRNELMGLASQMAVAEQSTKQLTEAYEYGKQTLGSFFSTLKNELMSGSSLWDSFGKAAISVLDNIANKALEMASNNIWDMIFGGLTGGITGGRAPLQLGFQRGIPGFATGGYTGSGSPSAAAGVVHGQEFVMNSDATRRIGVGTLQALNDNIALPANENGGGLYVTFAPVYHIDGIGLTMEELQEVLARNNEQLMDDLPNQLQSVQLDSRKRMVR